MPLTRNDVKQLADLARLQLTDQELEKAEHELDAILGYVDRLKNVDTTNVEPLTMPEKETGWREDKNFACDDVTRETILANFPSRHGDLLHVPAVFEKPKK